MPRKNDWSSAATAKRRSANRATVVTRRRQKVGLNRLKLNPTVAKLVDRRIDKDNESHHQGYWWRRTQFTNKISDDPANRIITIIPNVPTGATRADRLGAQIKLTRLSIKGKIDIPADDNPIVGNGDRAQIYVRLMVLSSKKFREIQEVRSNWNAGSSLNDSFFKVSDVGQAPTGQYVDMLRPINSEAFTTHYDRVIKMNRNAFTGDIAEGYAPQRPVSKDFKINLKVKNKLLKYDDNTSVQPDNFQPFVCALFAYSNGSIPTLSAVPFMEYLTAMSFKPN